MINNKLLMAAGVATLSASFFSASVTAATATGTADVTVLEPLAIATGTNSMDFGEVAGDADNGTTVSLSPGGVVTAGAGATAAGTPSAGDFDVTGESNLFYGISLPVSILLSGGGGADMTVDNFSSDAIANPQLSAAGTDSFSVGAVLNINANQGAGAYNGSYDITVNYQ